MIRRSLPLSLIALSFLAAGCASSEISSSDTEGPSPTSDTTTPADAVVDDTHEDIENVPAVDIIVPAPEEGTESASEAKLSLSASTAAPTVVYVNRRGRTYKAGTYDDPVSGTSFIVRNYGNQQIQFPAANYSDADWSKILGIVRAYFEPYAVTVVDERPASGAYIEIAVGDTYSSILSPSMGRNTVGIAPLGPCRVAKNSVGYVFTKLYSGGGERGLRGVAETIAHEAGHTLSLSHEALPSDLMSYSPTSPSKKFQDAVAACGPNASTPQDCSCRGKTTQNSHAQLLTAVGPKASAPTPAPTPTPTPNADTTAPKIVVVGPDAGASLAANSTIEVSADVTDDKAVASVELFWQFTNRTLPCDGSVAGVTCQTSGSRYTWRINVGSGQRAFYFLAKDAAGNEARSEMRTIQLGTTPPPAAVDAAPALEVRAPAENAAVASGTKLVFEAKVTDDKKVDSVRAQWKSATGTVDIPLQPTADASVYRAEVNLRAGATPGPREVVFVATDSAGQATTTAPRTVTVQ